ncbi:hypothetical protein WJX72_007052 [[Myrmecia] bisecta]|uniref:4-alpha-glucanotransferase n=1 Tax=[Myrmecia] bisecta TaxID=41462 RepID=A0AAW1QRE9_9CHLO
MATPSLKRTLSYNSMVTGEDLDEEYGANTQGPAKNRRAGVILHPTSLPGPYGSGEIGREAYNFVDWLASAGMQIWQVLPLVPPETEYWSPYSGLDALCGSDLLIDLDELIAEGLLDASDCPPVVPVAAAKFDEVAAVKQPLLDKAADRLLNESRFGQLRGEMDGFRGQTPWVEDSALFYCLAQLHEGTKHMAWWTWPEPLRFREDKAIADARAQYKVGIERFIAKQFIFDRQWKAVKAYANSKGVRIMGDMPIYVGGQSADVWAYPELFALTESGAPAIVSGVPPDAFSETGQLWGSPLFDWKAQKKAQYKWWVQRLGRAFQLYDETRIDHFRGFAGYWAVDADAETAMDGVWKKGPGTDLFDELREKLGDVPIVAEDLGVITPDVVALREAIGAPGMVVLQFAWGGAPDNPHLPHNHYQNSVCYPGTHDNETAVGWFQDSAPKQDKVLIQRYMNSDGADIAWDFILECMKSVSQTSIFLMQDVLRLDNSARMNFPGTTGGNWAWRIGEAGIWAKLEKEAKDLRALAAITDRLPPKTDHDTAELSS